MSNPLRLDLVLSQAIRYSCGCTIAVPFQDAAQLLGLAFPQTTKKQKPEWARGCAYYTVAKREYSCRVQLHVVKGARPEASCLSVESKFETEIDERVAANSIVPLAGIAKGLEALSSYDANDQRATANLFWTDPASVIERLTVPADWPSDVKIAGIELASPGGRATAIVQKREFERPEGSINGAVTTVSVYGGPCSLTPRQICARFRIVSRMGKAFRNGDWQGVAKEVENYDSI